MEANTTQCRKILSTLQQNAIAVTAFVLLLLAACVVTFNSVSSNPIAQDNERAKNSLLQRTKEISESQMLVDNSEQPPLFVQSATSRDIDGFTFQKLTNGKAEASKYTQLPNVTLTNSAGQTIVRFAVCLDSKLIDEKHCLRFQKVNIASGTQFSVAPKDWAGPRRGMMPDKYVQKDGKFVKDNRPLDLDSEAMWLPGSISDYTVVVLSMVFEDGTKWVTKK